MINSFILNRLCSKKNFGSPKVTKHFVKILKIEKKSNLGFVQGTKTKIMEA